MTRCSSAWGSAASMRCAPRARTPTASRTPSISSAGCARRGSRHAAGRPPRRGHRRRHDGDRCGRAVEAARRRGGDDLLPPRQGAHERVGVRAGTRADQGRHHPPLAAAETRRRQERQGRPASSSNTRRCATASSSAPARPSRFPPTRCSRRSARLSSRDARRQRRGDRAGRRPDQGRRRGPHLAAKVWAGGDCVAGGDDLTVSAVAQGRDAAESIHRALTSNGRACAWPTSATISSASSRPTRSGWPPRRRPTRPTMSCAPSRRAGAASSGRRSAKKAARRQRQRPALRRDLGRRPPAARPQQYRAHHRPRLCSSTCRRSSRSRRTGPTARWSSR